MSRVSAKVVLPDGSELRLFAELPHKLRVQSAERRFLLVGDDVFRIDDESVAATAAEAERVRALRWLIDAAAFGPLHRATECVRTGPAEFRLAAAGSAPVELTLRENTLLPSAFGFGGTTVTIVDWLRTSSTWIASELEINALGRCRIRFENASVGWDDNFFVPPATAIARGLVPAPSLTGMPIPGTSVAKRSPTPVVVDGKAARWACVADPGDWPGRVAAYRPLHAELERQGQQIFGFPLLFQEGEKRWLAAPFRQRRDGPAFAAPAGWLLREIPAARWLEVHPADGDLATKLANGERMLGEALRAQGLAAAGPIVAQPFFHLHEGEVSAEKLAAPTVRMAVRLR